MVTAALAVLPRASSSSSSACCSSVSRGAAVAVAARLRSVAVDATSSVTHAQRNACGNVLLETGRRRKKSIGGGRDAPLRVRARGLEEEENAALRRSRGASTATAVRALRTRKTSVSVANISGWREMTVGGGSPSSSIIGIATGHGQSVGRDGVTAAGIIMSRGRVWFATPAGGESGTVGADIGGTGGDGDQGNGGNGGPKKLTGESGDEDEDDGSDDDVDADDESESFWAKYNRWCVEYPVPAKGASAAVLNFTGDAICQIFFGAGAAAFDWRRAGTFTFLGAFLVGPSLHYHYLNLGRLFPAVAAGGSALASLKPTIGKLFVDQFLFAPFFIAVFFTCLLTLEGKRKEVPAKLRQDLGQAVVGNWQLWIPFQLLNFRLVPLQLQVLSANVFSVVWNIYLSYTTHKTVVIEGEQSTDIGRRRK